ncbi:MAG: hypothetical protein J3Q66DRAFT_402419 [Benniella sp.]|nr:MAG: hypothetical protein J3Q66DRAFT_402419 [Benniella sp.]
MPFIKLACFLAFLLALVSVASAQTTKRVVIEPDERFCLLLPRNWGSDIASHLHNSVSYCTSVTSVVRNARKFDPGFIRTVRYTEGPNLNYTQVTGQFNRDKFGLSASDHGGQADPAHPRGAQCVGFKYFVQFVEPNEEIYCLRCCHYRRDCPTNMSGAGCRVVMPGYY